MTGFLVLAVALALPHFQATAQEPTAPPRLPEQLRDQAEIDRLKRQIEIIRLRQRLRELQGLQDSELERKHKQLTDMRQLLEVNSEVRDLLRKSPELDAQYRRILDIETYRPACECLDNAQVNWLGGRGEQVGQATISLDGEFLDVRIGDQLGASGCSLQVADTESATIACGGATRTLVHNPINPSATAGQ